MLIPVKFAEVSFGLEHRSASLNPFGTPAAILIYESPDIPDALTFCDYPRLTNELLRDFDCNTPAILLGANLFHKKRHPAEMGEWKVGAYLSHLAVERNVSAST